MSLNLLVIVPPPVTSMANGPALAPLLIKYFMKSTSINVDYFDANAYFMKWLSYEETRAAVKKLLENEIDVFLCKDRLDQAELSALGQLLAFRETKYFSTDKIEYDRAGYDLLGVDKIFINSLNDQFIASGQLQLWNEYFDKVTDLILQKKPDHIVFSLLFHIQFPALTHIANHLRAKGFKGKYILGGAAIKLSDDRFIEYILNKINADLAYKFNIYHELSDLEKYLNNEIKKDSVGAFHYLDETNKLRQSKSKISTVKELAGPLDYTGLNLDWYKTVYNFPVLLSEGCYWGRCEFCDYPFLASNDPFKIIAIFRNPEHVVADVLQIYNLYNVTTIDLISDAVPFSYFQKLANFTNKLPLDVINLTCSIRAEPASKLAHFIAMRESGVKEVTIGVESLCDDILEQMKKGNNYFDTIRNIKMIKEQGIKVKANIIYDYPRMTLEHIDLTMKRLDELVPLIDDIGIHSFSLSPNAPIAYDTTIQNIETSSKENVYTKDHGWHHINFKRTDTSNELNSAINELYIKLIDIATALNSKGNSNPQKSTVLKMPFRWNHDHAIRETNEHERNLMLKIPFNNLPFKFFIGREVSHDS